MTEETTALDALRGEIDRIDDEIHELLQRRSAKAAEIAEAKRGTSDAVMQPGREAEVLRRVLERHRGPLPRSVVACIWREMIAAMVRLQGQLKVAVCAPQTSVGYWDLARAHYGLSTPMTLHRSANVVLRAVAERDGTVGLLPLPQEDDADPWWPQLVSERESTPRVIARLPFVSLGDGRFEEVSALVVATCETERTGADISLLAAAGRREISRASLNERLEEAGLQGRCVAMRARRDREPEYLHLVEIADFVAKKDARIDAFLAYAEGTVDRVVRLGGYAVPFRL